MANELLQVEVQTALGDSYTIERELPRGGMSRVFVATENALGRRVVIKVLSPELAAGLSADRFRREIHLAARLQHPHIIPLLSSGQAGRHLFYTMPLVDGESLRERMVRTRPMPIADVITIITEVAASLAYAHAEGIAHRDIKPENVMFFRGQAVVLDFGIGKALQSAAEVAADDPLSARITVPGTSLGTPTYIAPEQAAGDSSLDHRADLYALGVVAYEMLTGHPPFSGRSPQAVMAAHASQAPDPILPRRSDTPLFLAAIVMKCLEKAPAKRPQSGDEIVRALDPNAPPPRGGIAALVNSLPAWLPWALAGGSFILALVFGVLLLARRG